jgi:hypothetical protein
VTAPSDSPRTVAFFEQENRNRIERIRADIAGRLRKSCLNLSDEDFARLVEKMTRVQTGGEGRST